MKRSTLSTVIRYAAGGFALAAAVMFSPVLQADGEAKSNAPLNHVTTATFEATIRVNEKTQEPVLELVSLANQPTKADWKIRVMSTGEVKPLMRVAFMPKESYSQAGSTELAVKQTVVVPLDIPAAQGKESRVVYVDVGGSSLRVSGSAPIVFTSTK